MNAIHMGIREEILVAISRELREAKRPYCYVCIEQISKTENELQMRIQPKSARDERAVWADLICEASVNLKRSSGKLSKLGSIQTVDPELLIFSIKLRPDAQHEISIGDELFIFEVAYIESLKEVWNSELADIAIRNAIDFQSRKTDKVPSPSVACSDKSLNFNQMQGYGLLELRLGFLWGPPGTGKTKTMGQILADLLIQTTSKVLLVAPSNSACDLLLISADEALKKMGYNVEERSKLLVRAGINFLEKNYIGKEHLVPRNSDGNYIGTINAIARARLVALTTNAALFERIRNRINLEGPFDYIVIDEGSQVNLAQFLPITTLAKRVIVAGDPKQLPPVARFDDQYSKTWFGESAFKYRGENCVLLTEQFRMASDICSIVSGLYYERKLKVSPKVLDDPQWCGERLLNNRSDLPPGLKSNVCSIILGKLESWEKTGSWSRKMNSPQRERSLKLILDVVSRLSEVEDQKGICIITPFRAQAYLFKRELAKVGLKDVRISTAHKAQGEEIRTVIFDPVDATSGFLSRDFGPNLLNVAISRAKARFIVVFTEEESIDFSRRRDNKAGKAEFRPIEDLFFLIHDRGWAFRDDLMTVVNEAKTSTLYFEEAVEACVDGKAVWESLHGTTYESLVLNRKVSFVDFKSFQRNITVRDSESGAERSFCLDTLLSKLR